jgi:hypothetical protein
MMITPETAQSRSDDLEAGTNAAASESYDGEYGDHAEWCETIIDFLDTTSEARLLSERCRDYYDNKQWTPEQIKALKKRKQSPIVVNRIKGKLNGLLGLTSVRKGDPKAYPRNQEHDSTSAEACTDALRYVADYNALNSTFLECADNFFCEGYTCVNVIPETMPNGEIEIIVDHVPWDRIFFDPFSRKHDFSDAGGKGFGIWMDERDIVRTFPDMDPDALSLTAGLTDETFDDKPRWYYNQGKRRRFLVLTHYKKCDGQWCLAIYTQGGFLLQPMLSPYVDEWGIPDCPLEMEHAYIDRENNRYGELVSSLDIQDEINHRRSKALFLLSQRQTFGNRGAVKDIRKAKQELAKPDGHLEVGQGEFGKDFGLLPTNDMAAGQMELLMEAKQEMDGRGMPTAAVDVKQFGEMSGVALARLDAAGMRDTIKLFDNFGAFKLRVYKQIWRRVRQAWDYEKWVRVTDDEQKLRWVGFNIDITYGQQLQEIMDDTSKPYEMRLGASAQLIQLEQQNPEALKQVVKTNNRVAELDMDIILDEAYDTANVSQEQLDAILKYGAQNAFDIIDLLELSNITGKDKLIEKINNRKAEAAKAAQSAPPDPQAMYLTSKSKEADASAMVKIADAEQTKIENMQLQAIQPGVVPFKGNISI